MRVREQVSKGTEKKKGGREGLCYALCCITRVRCTFLKYNSSELLKYFQFMCYVYGTHIEHGKSCRTGERQGQMVTQGGDARSKDIRESQPTSRRPIPSYIVTPCHT